MSETLEIPLTQGKVAIIDADDWPLIADHKWHAQWNEYIKSYYAATNVQGPWGQRLLYMHALIAGKGADHVNHDTLDNRRSNLRLATVSENNANRRKQISNTSGYKGVRWAKNRGKWQVEIKFHGVKVHLGYFNEKINAARAYDSAAIEYFGEFALTNEMLGLLPAA